VIKCYCFLWAHLCCAHLHFSASAAVDSDIQTDHVSEPTTAMTDCMLAVFRRFHKDNNGLQEIRICR